MKKLLTAAALLVLAQAAAAQSALVTRLDSIVREAVKLDHLVGVSVAVVRGSDTILNRGYGFADLSLQVPTSTTATYRFTGLAIAPAVMREVEQGRLKLDDDISGVLSDFPWQGRHVTLRQLMDATSGLQDFHYSGDDYDGTLPLAKSPEEVTAIFANKPFMHEPGAKWQWTTSGFHLAGITVERSSGQSFADYVRQNIITPAGLRHTYYCDDHTVTPGLGRNYIYQFGATTNARMASASMYPYLSTLCTSALDAVSLLRAFRDGRLFKPATWTTMSTPIGAAASASQPMGIGIRKMSEGNHTAWGITGNLVNTGFAGADFVDDSLTIAVLTNTSSQAPARIMSNLARAVLEMPLLERSANAGPTIPEQVERTPVSSTDQRKYHGTYRLTMVDPPPQYSRYVRTVKVYSWNGRLMIKRSGEEPTPLLHQEGDYFVSRAGRATFTIENGQASRLELRTGNQTATGSRVP
jgi:D-alanyl-D-alanine carboxypeptidase